MRSRTFERPPALMTLYARALAGSVLPGGDELPDLELLLRDVQVDREHLAAYGDVCGFRLGDELPATYPHVLAFPLALSLMTERTFPFALLGLVHIANEITQARALRASDSLTVRVRAENLRPHHRGRQFDIVAAVEVEGEHVWRETSTYLKRGEGSGDRPRDEASISASDAAATWRVSGDIGRRYAAISGDRNPIHLHPMTARLFGFPSAIAHGMWMKARCLAALEGRLPDALRATSEFRSPLRIPGEVRFAARAHDGGFEFGLFSEDGEHTHLTGSAGPA